MIRGVVVAFVLVAALAGAAATGNAVAGTYQVAACFDAPHGETTAFTPANSSPQTITTSTECPPAPGATFSGLLVSTTLGAANSADGASASWSIAAPAGTTLSSLSVRRYFGKLDENWNVAVREADGTALETCDFDPNTQLECTVGSDVPTDAENYVTYGNLDTPSVSFGVVCQAGAFTCLSGSTQRQAWIAVYAATATVNDPDPPSIGTPQGSLIGAAGTWHRETEAATVPATDASGVKTVSLLVDGSPVATSPQSCDYTHMQPCPGSVDPTMNVDLADLADGPHELQVAATDAADQQQLTAASELLVDDHAPTAPLNLAVQRNGDGTYSATWTNPAQGAAAPIAGAHYRVCLQGGTSCSADTYVAGAGVSHLDSIAVPPSPARYELDVSLQDAAANTNPANAASAVIDTTTGPGGGGGSGGGGTGGGGSGTGGGGPPSTGRSAHLHIHKATQHGGVLTIVGTIAPAARGSIVALLRRAPTGRTRVVARSSVRQGNWTLRLRLSTRLREQMRYLLRVSYDGDHSYAAASLSRLLLARGRLTSPGARRGFRLASA